MLYTSVVPDAGLGQVPLGRPHVWHKQSWVFQGRLPPRDLIASWKLGVALNFGLPC